LVLWLCNDDDDDDDDYDDDWEWRAAFGFLSFVRMTWGWI
jgi:hypothetical protein